MVTIRATGKLLKRAKVPVAPDAEGSTTKLGDWYANVISYGRQRRILCVSERTLLPVLVPGAGLGRLPGGLLSGLEEVLVALGVSPHQVHAELAEMREWQLARTASRSVLGVMNDFARMLYARHQEPAPDLELALWLAEAPSGPLRMESPDRATLATFAGSAS